MVNWYDRAKYNVLNRNIFNWAGEERTDEAIQAFKPVGEPTYKQTLAQAGEGWESLTEIPGFGNVGLSSFNTFYNNHINRIFENEIQRILEYRQMAEMSEISDVIEDATNEAIQEDDNGKIVHLTITDRKLEENENIVRNIRQEFDDLFYERLDTTTVLHDMFRNYMVDGRVYYERIINKNKKSQGILNMKMLPAESMDFVYDPFTGKVLAYYQYLRPRTKRPQTIEDAIKDQNIVVFYPDQIGFINYGIFGRTRHEIFGYLEKSRIPYNQLKLLETSVIIYRIVRAPERLVFRIDTGNMPRDKALKYVEKIKTRMTKKQTYDPATGSLSQEPEVLSILENYYMPQSAEGRGSQIESVGGQSAGFTELDDIYYFSRKMYRALKYPLSRVSAGQEKREADIMFGGSQTGEITRDEVKWSRFLEAQQKRFCKDLDSLFLKHLELRGLAKEYGLNRWSFRTRLNPPSSYREQMDQNFMETRFNNYQTMADRPEFSVYMLMKKYLRWTDDEIQENLEGKKKDLELGLKSEEDSGF